MRRSDCDQRNAAKAVNIYGIFLDVVSIHRSVSTSKGRFVFIEVPLRRSVFRRRLRGFSYRVFTSKGRFGDKLC